MESIKEIFRIGYGPSSSHTMAPRRASELFLRDHKTATRFEITLFGALAATGKGHLTDKAILDVLGQDRTKIIWKADTFLDLHPNAMQFEAFDNEDKLLDSRKYYSIGGGKIIREDSNEGLEINEVYPHHSLTEILQYLDENGLTFWEYVQEFEHAEIWDYLAEVLAVMKKSVEDGLNEEGVLPGGLRLRRKAMSYYTKARSYKPSLKGRCLVQSYALAVSEQNAAGGLIVTAPTCGSCGVVPAVLYHLSKEHEFTDKQIIRSLATAGLFGSIIKHNASISGAEVGCQGEVGSACSMAAAAANQLFGGTPQQIEYAAEIGLEHHLGLTCDPVCGLVQVPCIERNAFAALRALDANLYAMMSDGKHVISFDKVVETMKQTGKDLPSLYKETAAGGLAVVGKGFCSI
ncbi:MAG: L-serine ammonia-lyase [Bacteroidales bacterium]|nr:L-serine ammonia-lyase [Bacteroidales bacterium]MBO7228437.1 L-serine ammonia-lyase [Bacteroidales bacterium]MBQ1192200.1 L-serine ammonia-lyase [Bacteroidales bacterium]MEE0900526.1 L-serine ammonia-lyase [Bacteroidales bacterium]MEE0918030.1 L-serine ammonia-lyase [Bacteroidales bacterium]